MTLTVISGPQLDPGHEFGDVLKLEQLEEALEILTNDARRAEYDTNQANTQKQPSSTGPTKQSSPADKDDAGGIKAQRAPTGKDDTGAPLLQTGCSKHALLGCKILVTNSDTSHRSACMCICKKPRMSSVQRQDHECAFWHSI